MRCAKLNQDSYKIRKLVHVATDKWIRHKWYEFSVDDDSKDIGTCTIHILNKVGEVYKNGYLL